MVNFLSKITGSLALLASAALAHHEGGSSTGPQTAPVSEIVPLIAGVLVAAVVAYAAYAIYARRKKAAVA